MPASSSLPLDLPLDPAQAAALLNVHPRTVARWAEAGKLNPMDLPTSPRRFAQSELLRLMVDIKGVQKGAAARAPATPAGGTRNSVQEVAVAEADLEARLTAAAVATAAALASDAAARARDDREIAGREATRLVAEAAAQSAVATRARAAAAAARVRKAAKLAAALERSSAGQDDSGTLPHAVLMAATVEAAASAMAEDTAALERLVAETVAKTAASVAATQLALDLAIEAEVAASAVAVELRAMATAHLTAIDAAVRLRRLTRSGQASRVS
jgi:hypothetical protein